MAHRRARAQRPRKPATRPAKKADKVIEYTSYLTQVTRFTNDLVRIEKDGINCIWSGKIDYPALFPTYLRLELPIAFTWNFDWTKLKLEGVESVSGHVIVKSPQHTFPAERIHVNWTDGEETVITNLQSRSMDATAGFEFHLTAHYAEIEEISYDEMFAASEMNDTVLVVDGKKLHVNKVFLAYHSDFFRALFFSGFQERNLAEIPIKDLSFEDFGLLMSAVYPQQVFPNDRTAEKLLELADRFLMPAVTRQVEHHLLGRSKIKNEKLMCLADDYGMPMLLEKCIGVLNTVAKIKTLQKTTEYVTLSDGAKVKIMEKLMTMI